MFTKEWLIRLVVETLLVVVILVPVIGWMQDKWHERFVAELSVLERSLQKLDENVAKLEDKAEVFHDRVVEMHTLIESQANAISLMIEARTLEFLDEAVNKAPDGRPPTISLPVPDLFNRGRPSGGGASNTQPAK